jgi:spore germination protein KC
LNTRTRLLLMLALLGTLCSAGGCRDRVEISELGIVSALGIDLAPEPGMYEVTAQVVRPSGVGTVNAASGGRPFAVVTTTGNSVFDAVRKATTISSRRLFFSHDRVVIIGRTLAERGVYPVIDLLVRDEEFRPDLQLLVATGKAKDVIYSVTEFERVPGVGLAKLLNASMATSSIGLSKLQHFRRSLASLPGLQPVASLVDSVTAASVGDDRSFVGSKVSPEQGSVPERILRLVGTAIFLDDRMVGTLDLTESRGYRWVVGEVDSGIVNIRMPESGQLVDLEIVATKSNIKVEMDGDTPKVSVLLQASAQIGSQEGDDNLTSIESLEQVEAQYAAAVQHEVAAAIAKAQQQQTDIFGFGDKLRAKQPQAWKQLKETWPETFSKLQIEIAVRTHVDRYGLIGASNHPNR